MAVPKTLNHREINGNHQNHNGKNGEILVWNIVLYIAIGTHNGVHLLLSAVVKLF